MAKELAERVGARIRQRREDLGLTQQQVADRMANKAVSNQHVSNWERGVYLPSDDNQLDLATALEVTVAFFYADEPKSETPDLMGALSNGGDQLDRIERLLTDVSRRLALLEDLVSARELEGAAQATEQAGEPGQRRRGRRGADVDVP